MGTLASRPNSPRISLTRNITSAHTLEELKTQISEFVNKLEDYLNSQIGIHFLQDNRRRPTLIAGDLVFDFTNHPEFATLQQWDGEKLIPLDLSAISGYIDLVAQGIGSGTDASLFLRSDGAGHWVLAAGPVGPAGPTGPAGADGASAYDVAVANGFVGSEADWLMSLIGPAGPTGAAGATGATGAAGATGPPGATGAAGATGATGAVGATGPAGIDGAVWYNGASAPAGGLGINGDYYLRTSNGDVYFKSSGSWSVILNIIGPAGAAGAAGATGATGATGAPGATGATGATGAAGATGSTGATGAAGPGALHGSGNPGAGLGVDDEIYFNTVQGDIWLKVSGTWILYGTNAYYFQGKPFITSAPSNGDVIVFDSSIGAGGSWKGAPPTGGSGISYVPVLAQPAFL